MKKIAVLLGFCMAIAFLPTFIPQPVYAMTGSGTAGDPYIIYNVTDLQDMANNLSAYYELANDIDASTTSGWNGGAGFAPVGTFTGHFDGNGYTITGLFINRGGTSQVGLFGKATSATIANVTLADVDITGNGIVGGLVGYAYQFNNISYCSVTGEITGNSNGIGGLIGQISALLSNEYTYVTRCAADVIVIGTHTCSGYGALIGSCYKAAVVSQSCSYGSVYGGCGVGGLIGQVVAASGCSVADCYSMADVTGVNYGFPYNTSDIGGFVGVGSGLSNCYSTGFVTCSSWDVCYHVGGFIGQASSGCTACFWDKQTSNWLTSECGTGKSTAEMKTESTYVGWNFSGVWSIGGYVNDGYPYFAWWYNPPDIIADVNQVVWFQPNAIIEGIILPNRAQSGTLQDGEFTWGANPAGVTITHGELIPEEEYDFEPVIPSGQDIIKPEPETMIGDVDTERLHNNPLYPLVQVLSIGGFLNERLVWLGLAWFILIAAMFGVHLGFDTHKGSERPQHFVLTTIVGLGFSILFYTMGIFPWWVILVMALGLVGSIIWERQPVL